jgi:hypothetical protein
MGAVTDASKVEEARKPFKDWPNDAGVSDSLASQYHSQYTQLFNSSTLPSNNASPLNLPLKDLFRQSRQGYCIAPDQATTASRTLP